MFLIVVRAFDGTINSKTVKTQAAAQEAAIEAFMDRRTAEVSISPVA